ncbi:hypothetical protein AOLI_G00091990 [Acnodon oligacanthus]
MEASSPSSEADQSVSVQSAASRPSKTLRTYFNRTLADPPTSTRTIWTDIWLALPCCAGVDRVRSGSPRVWIRTLTELVFRNLLGLEQQEIEQTFILHRNRGTRRWSDRSEIGELTGVSEPIRLKNRVLDMI